MKTIKTILCMLVVVLATAQLHAQSNLPLSKEIDDPYQHGGRSLDVVPTATLDGTTITLTYPLATESQVEVTDQSTLTVVYSETFTATRSLTIDLTDEGLAEGTYTLRVYAFGKWWTGEFELEER